jgi:DNA replication protein DnaC
MIITSNKSFTKCGGVLGDKVLATAIIDRLLHYAEVVSLRGDSCRAQGPPHLVLGGDKLK